MLQIFYPKKRVKSIMEIDFAKLYEAGYRGVIFDIDNTLVPHGKPATPEIIDFFVKLREIGFQTRLLSNNQKDRVEPFALAVQSPYIYNAHKPSRTNYLLAVREMNLKIDETLFVGDQLFTDIYGANRSNIESILVDPIHKKEEIQIVLKRKLEKIVLFFYNKSKKY